jgi:pyrimidine 5'-nucleotidase
MNFSTIFFDLDDTLYPSSTGLWGLLRERMVRYMWERMDIPQEQVLSLRREYFEKYGTTLRGLQMHHHLDVDDYLAYVHDVPLQEYLKPDPRLRQMLLSLPQHKWIFTNADFQHSQRVLTALDLEGCFEGIIDIRRNEWICKPDDEAYRRAMAIAGETFPVRCLMLDDSTRNLEPAHRLGIFTVLVGSDRSDPAADLSISSLLDLRQALPGLFNGRPPQSSGKEKQP